jgi:REP element-mobilizing transposase RayT
MNRMTRMNDEMAQRRQLELFGIGDIAGRRAEHGGSLATGRRKGPRPIDTRRPMHLVMRSSRARGEWSLRRREHDARIRAALRRASSRFGIRVYEFANAGNHLHLLIRARRRSLFQGFLRTFAGAAARCVTSARRGRRTGSFWDGLTYSRVVGWGREFIRVRSYVVMNEREGKGLIPPQPRGRRKVHVDSKRTRASATDRAGPAQGPPIPECENTYRWRVMRIGSVPPALSQQLRE